MNTKIIPLVGLLLGAFLLSPLPASAEERQITCESPRKGENYCRTRTQGRVDLVDQLSSTPCIKGRTWGYDDSGIWVRNGCRAVFRTGGERHWGGGGGSDGQDRVVCESRKGRHERCPVRTENRVRLVRQFSGAPCVEGRTWGYDRDEVWVEDGCRAEFAVGRGPSRKGGGRPSRDDEGPAPVGAKRVVNCQSPERRYQRCPMRTEGRVELLRQYSSAGCVEGRSWGYDRNGIWVDRGCRAQFQVGRGRY